MSTCNGTYAATLLQPLPTPMVVALDIRDDSPANVRMGDRFLAGLRDAGVAVGAAPNVVLHVATYRIIGTPKRPEDGEERSYSEMSGLGGGHQYEVPAVSGVPLVPRGPSAAPMLILRIEATEGQAQRTSWVASVQCQLIGTDDGQRAQDIGRVLGAVLGQRVELRPL